MPRPHQAENLGGDELVASHKGPESCGQGRSVQPFRPDYPRCQARQARVPHTVGNLKHEVVVTLILLDLVGEREWRSEMGHLGLWRVI